jgi:hypothetical protein
LAVNRITINNTTEIPVLAIEENGLEVNMWTWDEIELRSKVTLNKMRMFQDLSMRA